MISVAIPDFSLRRFNNAMTKSPDVFDSSKDINGLPNPKVETRRPIEIDLFCPLVLWVRLSQYAINHAVGIDAMEEPNEYGRSFIPDSSGVSPLAA
jgi:hypothetical protein